MRCFLLNFTATLSISSNISYFLENLFESGMWLSAAFQNVSEQIRAMNRSIGFALSAFSKFNSFSCKAAKNLLIQYYLKGQ